jgi:hypothetical protein
MLQRACQIRWAARCLQISTLASRDHADRELYAKGQEILAHLAVILKFGVQKRI